MNNRQVIRSLLLVSVAVTLPVDSRAQQKISGVARDADTGTPLPCIDVWLLRSDSSEHSRLARTRADGSFTLETTPSDSATLLFRSWGVQVVKMPVPALIKGVDHTAVYALPIAAVVGSAPPVFTSKDTTEGWVAPSPIPANSTPSWPRSRWLTDPAFATIVVRYVVDSIGKVRDTPVEALVGAQHRQYIDAVRTWLRRTKFNPGTFRGVPRCEMMTINFRFRFQ